MPAIKFKNNAAGTLSAGITNVATTIVLGSGQGASFPTLAAGDWFYGTLVGVSGNLEIVKVTARSTDTLTVTRAQDGTTGQAFVTADRFELRITAAVLEDLKVDESQALAGAFSTSKLTMATARLVGRTTASVGAPEEITVGNGLTLSAGNLAANVTSVNGQTGAASTTTHLGIGAVQILYNFSRTGVASGSTAIAASSLGYASAAPSSGAGLAFNPANRSGNVTVPGSPEDTTHPTTTAVTGTWQSMSYCAAGVYEACGVRTIAQPGLFVRTA